MKNAFEPVLRQSLADRLARRIRGLIQNGAYREGDRLPPIMEMARQFGVGHPTVREALKKLETVGVVEIRHGSGVYVSKSQDVLVLASPDFAGKVTKKLLLDLIQARMPIEMQSTALAVRNATPEHFDEMRALLEDLPLTHLHVFPYSDRPGTAASVFGGKVDGSATRARGAEVRRIGERMGQRFRESLKGTTRRALAVDDGMSAVTDNYLKGRLDRQHPRNAWVDVML